MSGVTALLLVLLAPCGQARGPALQAALAARDATTLWAAEAALRATPRCEAPSGAPTPTPAPARIEVPPLLPAPPVGPGAGPWMSLGLAAALGAGVLYLDFAANDSRDALDSSQRAGDRRAFEAARSDFEAYRLVARGLTVTAGVAALGGLLWLAVGGDDDPVQTRPIFGAEAAGLSGRF